MAIKMTDKERSDNAQMHLDEGGECARCDKPAKLVVQGLAYCSKDCENRISDYGLDDAQNRQYRYSKSGRYKDILLIKELKAQLESCRLSELKSATTINGMSRHHNEKCTCLAIW